MQISADLKESLIDFGLKFGDTDEDKSILEEIKNDNYENVGKFLTSKMGFDPSPKEIEEAKRNGENAVFDRKFKVSKDAQVLYHEFERAGLLK